MSNSLPVDAASLKNRLKTILNQTDGFSWFILQRKVGQEKVFA
jgi:hypothetical protein